MATYNNTLHDLISFLKAENEGNCSFSTILPTLLTIELDGISGMVIGNLFSVNKDLIPHAYSGLDYVVRKIRHNIQGNTWITTIEAYPFKYHKGNDALTVNTTISEHASKGEVLKPHTAEKTEKATVSVAPQTIDPKDTKEYNTDRIKTAVSHLKDKSYNKYAIAALIGGFLQESGLRPTQDSTYNGQYQYGIAQWTKSGGRLNRLFNRKDHHTLDVQLNYVTDELVGDEGKAGDILKNANTLDEALKGSDAYERYAKRGNRYEYAQDILNRINSGEFGDPQTFA